MYAIEVDNVTKIYRKGFRAIRVPAVTGLSFAVRKETITGFVGPNGAGKTTTIKMLAGLVRPTSGNVRILGRDAREPQARRGVSFLSEQPYFYAHLTVSEMLRFTAQLNGVSAALTAQEIARVLEAVELTHKAHVKIREMSKGMQQRLNMAQVLLGRPHTLILDEPMSGMDPPGRRLFRKLLANLRREQGTTLFFSTHVLDDIETLCDDVVVLSGGKLSFAGPVKTLLDEGLLGSEMVCGELDAASRKAVADAGGRMQQAREGGEWSVFVPREIDPGAIQRILYEHNVFPLSVQPCSLTLEELLYRHSTEEPA
jgi:ABC-2 type transport system ATP-binding protein